jgi:SAM-dependent methyltransferase
MENLDRLYDKRFTAQERRQKEMVWQVLCEAFLQRYVDPQSTVLDLGCGFGEFIRNIRAAHKIAVDANPAVVSMLPPEVEFHNCGADDLGAIADESVNTCFTSNFFEHLPSKLVMDNVLAEVRRTLRPGGLFVAIQPNIRYAVSRYWDCYDHQLPLSDLSAKEGFEKNGYEIVELIPRFLPWSIKSRYPKHPLLVHLYLHARPAWRFLGRQFLIVARKAESAT